MAITAGQQRWTIDAIADALGMDPRSVKKTISAHRIRPTGTESGNAVYDIREVIDARTKPASGSEEDDMPPGQLLLLYKAKNEKLRYEKSCDDLMLTSVFREREGTLCKTIAAWMDALPETLQRKCGLDHDTVEAMQAELDELRNALVDSIESDVQ